MDLRRSKMYFWIGILYVCLAQSLIVSGRDYHSYSPEELLALKEIRRVLDKELYIDIMKTNGMLIHALRAQNSDVPKAIQMLRNIIQWRKENKIDKILLEDMSDLQRAYPYWLDLGAKHGGPICTVPIWDIRKITVGGLLPRIMRYIDRIFEEGIMKTLAAAKSAGKEITQGVVIADLNGYTMRTHGCVSCLPFYYNFLTHYENYYPQAASDLFLINAPRIFNTLLTVLHPLMSEATRRDLQVFGTDKEEWKKAILKVVPINRLRKHLGGEL